MTWLKLDIGILQDEKIDDIRAMTAGDSLFVLWVGLLCLAMKQETDVIYVTQGVAITAEHLA